MNYLLNSPKLSIKSRNLIRRCISVTTPITNEIKIVNTKDTPTWPMLQILDPQGNLVNDTLSFVHSRKEVTEMYRYMNKIQALDDILYNAQRQGRISFYMQNAGEEAIHIGSSAALTLDDMIFAQYRESGVLLWRGLSYQQAMDQCFSNELDLGRGRQMPVHYGSKELKFQTISSPLTTQLPQAVGAAYAYKLANSKLSLSTSTSTIFNTNTNTKDNFENNQIDLNGDPISNDNNSSLLPSSPGVVCCYFGEGAASEGDFHAALNFASVLNVPILFFCRNNGYAISTPTADQYSGDGIVSRAVGYGMHGIRVDGNDLFAIRAVTEYARDLAITQNVPVLIEAMTYRRGHHSTSDDSTKYRSIHEIKYWHNELDPLTRVRRFMEKNGWWNETDEINMKDQERMAVIQALEIAEKRRKPPVYSMFDDVYKEQPIHLKLQEQELFKHIEKYPVYYQINSEYDIRSSPSE